MKYFTPLRIIQIFACAAILLTSSCNSDPPSVEEETININAEYKTSYQTIDGFGGSNAWTSLRGDTEEKALVTKLLFSRTEGIGLSILRTRIPFRENPGDYRDGFISADADGTYLYTENSGMKYFSFNWNSWEVSHTRELISSIKNLGTDGPEDLTIMATPWTPPNNWKTDFPDNSLPAYGGKLNPVHYSDYADILADFVLGYKANMGEALDAISVQNEPNYVPTSYESCGWTADEIRDFLKIMGPRFTQKGVRETVKVIASEGMHFNEDMVLAILADDDAKAAVDIIGVHQYNHDEEWNMAAKELSTVQASGKPLWQTEVSTGEANDSSITDGLYWAKLIHLDMTLGNVNAFLYWWLWSTSGSKGALINYSDDEILLNKRLFTMGNFSRFIRPGWQRIEITANPVPGLFLSAYKNPEQNKIAIVTVNQRASETAVDISINGINSLTSIEQWQTSDTLNLEQINAPETKDSTIAVVFPKESVTTIYAEVE